MCFCCHLPLIIIFACIYNKIEGWLSPTERASVSAISLRQNLATSRESRGMSLCRCLHPFCGWRHLATSRESKAHFGLPWLRLVLQPVSSNIRHFLHILASPGYAPGTIAVNVSRLEKGFNACKTPRCIYTSIFNRF